MSEPPAEALVIGAPAPFPVLDQVEREAGAAKRRSASPRFVPDRSVVVGVDLDVQLILGVSRGEGELLFGLGEIRHLQ